MTTMMLRSRNQWSGVVNSGSRYLIPSCCISGPLRSCLMIQHHPISNITSRSYSSSSTTRGNRRRSKKNDAAAEEQHVNNNNNDHREVGEVNEDEKRLKELEQKLKDIPETSFKDLFKQLGILVGFAVREHVTFQANKLKYRKFLNHVLDVLESKRDVIERVMPVPLDRSKLAAKNFVIFPTDSPLAKALNTDQEPLVITISLTEPYAKEHNLQASVDAVVIGKLRRAVDGDSGVLSRLLPKTLPLLGDMTVEAELESLSLLVMNEKADFHQEIPLYQKTPTNSSADTEGEDIQIIEEQATFKTQQSSSSSTRNTTTIDLEEYIDKSDDSTRSNKRRSNKK